MSTVIYDSSEDHNAGSGQIVVTQCSNGAGKGMRLEVYASRLIDQPAHIYNPLQALRLGLALCRWAWEVQPECWAGFMRGFMDNLARHGYAPRGRTP